jgi:hypothetical protein
MRAACSACRGHAARTLLAPTAPRRVRARARPRRSDGRCSRGGPGSGAYARLGDLGGITGNARAGAAARAGGGALPLRLRSRMRPPGHRRHPTRRHRPWTKHVALSIVRVRNWRASASSVAVRATAARPTCPCRDGGRSPAARLHRLPERAQAMEAHSRPCPPRPVRWTTMRRACRAAGARPRGGSRAAGPPARPPWVTSPADRSQPRIRRAAASPSAPSVVRTRRHRRAASPASAPAPAHRREPAVEPGAVVRAADGDDDPARPRPRLGRRGSDVLARGGITACRVWVAASQGASCRRQPGRRAAVCTPRSTCRCTCGFRARPPCRSLHWGAARVKLSVRHHRDGGVGAACVRRLSRRLCRPRHAGRTGHRTQHPRVRSRPEMDLGSAS